MKKKIILPIVFIYNTDGYIMYETSCDHDERKNFFNSRNDRNQVSGFLLWLRIES